MSWCQISWFLDYLISSSGTYLVVVEFFISSTVRSTVVGQSVFVVLDDGQKTWHVLTERAWGVGRGAWVRGVGIDFSLQSCCC